MPDHPTSRLHSDGKEKVAQRVLQVGEKWNRRFVAFLILIAIGWAVMSRNWSIKSAVPAGRQHVEGSVAAVPDRRLEQPEARNFVDVKFMTRGYCYAASQVEDTEAPGGFGRSKNVARKVRPDSQGRGLFLLAQPRCILPFADSQGMRVVLVNQTEDLIALPACDSRLDIIQEAQDENGVWRPIEYLPSSWCGNSYHRVFLAPNHFWEFAAPRYKGAFETKLRFSMQLRGKSRIVSNSFAGSVNPEQFTEKQGHTATNIMDPYDD